MHHGGVWLSRGAPASVMRCPQQPRRRRAELWLWVGRAELTRVTTDLFVQESQVFRLGISPAAHSWKVSEHSQCRWWKRGESRSMRLRGRRAGRAARGVCAWLGRPWGTPGPGARGARLACSSVTVSTLQWLWFWRGRHDDTLGEKSQKKRVRYRYLKYEQAEFWNNWLEVTYVLMEK